MGKQTVRVMKDLNKFLEKTMKDVSGALDRNLKEDTPKDTGYAENNWVANTGTAFKGTAGTRDEAEAGQLDFGPRKLGFAKIVAYKLSQGEIHHTNNVGYILDLNDGTSQQAPKFFVEMAIDRSIREAI